MAITAEAIFGEIVYTLRNKAGLTQEQLAAASFYSRDYIYRIEKGNRGPGVKTFSRLAPPFKVTALELHAMFLKRLREEGIHDHWVKSE